MQSKLNNVLIGAFVIGLGVRLALLVTNTALEPRIVDEQHYTELAANIVEGNGFAWGPGDPTSIRPPLYPSLLAGIWSMTGPDHYVIVRMLQFGMAALTAFLLFRLGTMVFDKTVGKIAAAVFWLYPSVIFFNITLLTETLFTLLLTAFVLMAVTLSRRPAIATGLCTGALLGLAALSRSVLFPLPLVLCPLLVFIVPGAWSRRLLVSSAVLAGFAVLVGPWALRNTRLQGVPTFVDTMGGLNLRMGNYEFTPEDRMWDAVSLDGEKGWSHALQTAFPGQHLTEGQKDKWAQRQAIEYMKANPATTLRRSAIKFADFWGLEREYAAGIAQGLYSPPRWFGLSSSAVIVVAYMVVALTFAAGVWLRVPNRTDHVLMLLPVVSILGVHTIVFGHSRYHIPLVPIMLLYSTAFVTTADWASFRRRRLALYGATLCICTLAGIWTWQIVVSEAAHIRALLNRAG